MRGCSATIVLPWEGDSSKRRTIAARVQPSSGERQDAVVPLGVPAGRGRGPLALPLLRREAPHLSGLVATNSARLFRRARCALPPPRVPHADEQKRLLAALAKAKGAEAERDRMLDASFDVLRESRLQSRHSEVLVQRR